MRSGGVGSSRRAAFDDMEGIARLPVLREAIPFLRFVSQP